MGTSVEQIDRTYGHLLPGSEEYLRGLLDVYDAETAAENDETPARAGVSSSRGAEI